jgi:hypothetical protein
VPKIPLDGLLITLTSGHGKLKGTAAELKKDEVNKITYIDIILINCTDLSPYILINLLYSRNFLL